MPAPPGSTVANSQNPYLKAVEQIPSPRSPGVFLTTAMGVKSGSATLAVRLAVCTRDSPSAACILRWMEGETAASSNQRSAISS